tara:strand:+ start:20143 stop:20907 length:765 start_codon:yes stop_codon:yes gene_type:complete
MLTFTLNAYAVETVETLQDGIQAIRGGDKQKGWEILFPLANEGNTEAMFHLGDMMLRSPEFKDHLQRAREFFTVAASRGHEGAKSLIPRVDQFIAQSRKHIENTIAGASGTPLNGEIETINRQLQKYKSEVLRFTNSSALSGVLDTSTLMFFTDNRPSSIEQIYKIGERLKAHFGDKVNTRLLVRIMPEDIGSSTPPLGGFAIPPGGVTPDFKGAIASSYGIQSLPALVFVSGDGTPTMFNDFENLELKLNELL